MNIDVLSSAQPITQHPTPLIPPDTGPPGLPSSLPPKHDPFNHQQPPRWADSTSDEHRRLSHRLLQLDYSEKLPFDAVPLVRHLLADLIKTTDTVRRIRTDLDIANRDAKQAKDQVS